MILGPTPSVEAQAAEGILKMETGAAVTDVNPFLSFGGRGRYGARLLDDRHALGLRLVECLETHVGVTVEKYKGLVRCCGFRR
jgi:hypothetical protein